MATASIACPGLEPRRGGPAEAPRRAMKKVYSSDSYFLVGHLRQLLENNHIKCIAKNEFLFGAAGQLPPTECWPELWIAEDFQYDKAKELVEGFLAGSSEGDTEWRCPECGERLEAQFTVCWSCGAERQPPFD